MVLLVSSIGFWWYCNNGVENILVGIALFEVFHDVQYLAIVWIYNRTRVERDKSIGGFMRFVFRRSGALIGVYVGLVLAYGAIGLTQSAITVEWIRHSLIGIVTASALLHFYYDGFIWKVRETQTRAMLGIEGAGAAALASPRFWPPWIRHSLRWAALVIPFGVLCATQLLVELSHPSSGRRRLRKSCRKTRRPNSITARPCTRRDDVEEAISRYEFAIGKKPRLADAEFYLGLAWSDLADRWRQDFNAENTAYLDRSLQHYERVAPTGPEKNGKCELNLAGVLVAKGMRAKHAADYEHSLSVNPDLQIAHKELADILCGDLEYESAIAHYEEALRIQPDFMEAKQNLSFARTLVGQ